MRQLNNIITHSSDTSNSMSTSKQASNDTDKILNIKCESNNDISNINGNTLSPINLFRKHKERFYNGLNNKLYKMRIFFANLVPKSTNSSDNNDYCNNNKNIPNNLNDCSFSKHHTKYYSIALNLIQCDQSLYENTHCTCGKKDDKMCVNCLNQGKFNNDKNCYKNSNKQLTGIMATPSQLYSMTNKSSLEYDTTLPLDILNSTSLLPASISLIQNPNYVLYDIPELDESDENIHNESNIIDYYYNHNNIEKV